MHTSRRKFIQKSITLAAVGGVGLLHSKLYARNAATGEAAFQFEQIKLPYTYSALEPYIDGQTMELHYAKHHASYVKNVNAAITEENTSFKNEKEFFDNMSKLSAKIRNNAGGAWNHNFFWQVMAPSKNQTPTGKVAEAINNAFGTFDLFKEKFTNAAMTRFGSGWAWLVVDNGKLTIGSTPNQDNPLMDNSEFKGTPILGIDVWEHAYYLKYQNKRNEYVANFFNVINWDFVGERLG